MKTFNDYNIDTEGKAGAEIRVLCPECSKDRKKAKKKDLSVNTMLGTWLCHHCGWKGGLNGNGKVYIKPEYTAETDLPENVLKYFKERCISETTLKTANIGYGNAWMPGPNKEVSTIQFPFYRNSVVVNIKYRDGHKNFRQAKDAEKCLYGYDNMKNKSDTLIITEGEVDCLSFIEAGYHEVVSIPDGAPPENTNNYSTKFDFLKSAEEQFSKYKKIILAMDSDGPGKRAEKELARRIGIEKCWTIKYPEGCKDGNDTLKNHGRESLKDSINNAKAYPVSGMFNPSDFKDLAEIYYNNGIQRGCSTGWNGVDQYYTIRHGELTVITGIPSSGKSNWLDCVMLNLIENNGWKFAVFSPENWPIERHIQTLSEKITRMSFFNSYIGYERMDISDLRQAINYIDDKIFFIQPDEDKEEPNIDKILSLAKIALFRHGIDALIIDPFNEVSHDYGKLTETQYISETLGKIRRFGRLNGIHIFIVAHPKNLQKNQNGTYSPPTMYDIAGSANWRNKADNGICVHRSYKEGEKDITQIFVQKVRFRDVGKVGEHKLRYIYANARYEDDVL